MIIPSPESKSLDRYWKCSVIYMAPQLDWHSAPAHHCWWYDTIYPFLMRIFVPSHIQQLFVSNHLRIKFTPNMCLTPYLCTKLFLHLVKLNSDSHTVYQLPVCIWTSCLYRIPSSIFVSADFIYQVTSFYWWNLYPLKIAHTKPN